ncbi:tumor necrosis factor ligand superfamily member 13B [Erpetoichthys calabaricus]|uniref:TNF superfamily member 13b n=2 Tax=Polypteridae TaxID=8289 RepID=A0A8C4RWC2_ERPCA|nr:tumor necrosis factor ligand superfamily member 13B [Erpetoichthys calabaricus]
MSPSPLMTKMKSTAELPESDTGGQRAQRYLLSAVAVTGVAALMCASLFALSLYHLMALKAEVASLKMDLLKKREWATNEPLGANRQEVDEDEIHDTSHRDVPQAQTRQKDRVRRSRDFNNKTVLQACLHMIADNSRSTFQKDMQTAIPWHQGLRRGPALEHEQESNAIVVREAGYFFVYSQVYYMDRTFAMGHVIIRKKAGIVGNELRIVNLFHCIQHMNEDYPFNTCYTAGIAKLEQEDSIELLIPRPSANVSLDGDSTFFGAIKLA